MGPSGRAPYEVTYGRKPELSHLRRFGCVAHKLVPKELRRGKFTPRAAECVMVGYVNRTREICWLWDLKGGQLGNIINTSYFRFGESTTTGRWRPNLPETTIPNALLSEPNVEDQRKAREAAAAEHWVASEAAGTSPKENFPPWK